MILTPLYPVSGILDELRQIQNRNSATITDPDAIELTVGESESQDESVIPPTKAWNLYSKFLAAFSPPMTGDLEEDGSDRITIVGRRPWWRCLKHKKAKTPQHTTNTDAEEASRQWSLYRKSTRSSIGVLDDPDQNDGKKLWWCFKGKGLWRKTTEYVRSVIAMDGASRLRKKTEEEAVQQLLSWLLLHV
ncbi:hypothetical protein BC829DRAFT_431404 [Chytridium lagenaria]|nr:hypothetical protein BC829DRAFT_431404 [Chytridium lagenaria]